MPENIFLNPNEPNPAFMVYREEARKIILRSLAGKSECFWILGPTGMGKSTFLLWLKEFAPLYKIQPLYFHGGDDFNYEQFKSQVDNATKASFFSRIFLKKKYTERPVMILLDEIEYIKDENIWKYLINLLDAVGLHLTVVMASIDVIEDIKKYFKGREIEKIYLEKPPIEVLMEMVRKRIEAGGGEEFQPFGKQLVRDIIESSSTIREILVRLQEVVK
ncbi:MAG: AAA family ATPase [Thermoplasmata archaeon]|nr:AAA family ATPase [Thermoplasmata archaeon]